MNIRYRLTQFWWNVTAQRLPESACREIESVLTQSEQNLFARFDESEQWHAYRVYCTLKEAGYSQANLLTAALLHDVGKTRNSLSPRDRVLIVILEALMPKQLDKWGQGKARGWKRPFVVRAQHARWGADMTAAAGSAPETVNLILRHQDDLTGEPAAVEDELLFLLQQADDQN